MDANTARDLALRRFVRDPLIRAAMASDGVSEEETLTVLRDAQRAVLARGEAPPPPATAWRDYMD